MKRMLRRWLSMALSVAMCLSLATTVSWAVEPESPVQPDSESAIINGDEINETQTYPNGVKIESVPTSEVGLLTMTVDGVEYPLEEGSYSGEVVITVTDKFDGAISSYKNREADDYRTALYVDGSGLVDSLSVYAAITTGKYDDNGASGLSLEAYSDSFSGVLVNNGHYSIADSKFVFLSDSDGSLDKDWVSSDGKKSWKTEGVSDFVGFGAVIGAFNDSYVLVDNVDILSKGVAKLAMFTDGGSDVVLTDSTIETLGGVLYADYISTADQNKMVAPPWVLGITGNARTTNLEGENTSFTVVNVDAYSEQWGVLSTDAGKNMQMVMIDTSMTLRGANGDSDPFTTKYGSGYATYMIGSKGPAKEYFYGCDLRVGTFATISTGGCAVYASSDFSEENPYKYSDYMTVLDPNSTSKVVRNADGTVTVYAPDESVNGKEDSVVGTFSGEGKITTVYSDGFGVMTHSNGGDFTITDGTVFDTQNAIFLLKGGASNIYVNDQAQLNAADGVILQMMDNDDTLVGVQMGVEHYNGPTFNTIYTEPEGYPGIDYECEVTGGGAATVATFEDVTLVGDFYNATGYFASTKGRPLTVCLGKDAQLTGLITSSSSIHVDENGEQRCSFTEDEYYYMGRVANKAYSNGVNTIDVVLSDNAVWNVTADGIVRNLTASSKAIVADKPVSITVEGTLTLDGKEVTENTTVANVTYIVEAEEPAPSIVTLGSFGSEAAAPRYATAENVSKDGLKIEDSVSWHNGVVVDAPGAYTLTNSKIIMDTTADGSDTNDFSGLGAAVMVNGVDPTDNPEKKPVMLTIENTEIVTKGVAKLALFTDGGAVSIVKNSSLSAYGGVIYDGYMSTADQSLMVSPPWVLGLGGNAEEPCDARTTNLMGKYSVAAYVDSYFYAKGWGALSTDSGTNMNMVVVNSKVEVETSGYGAYNIGESLETYYGSEMDVSTYGIIMTGGEASFQSYTGGQEVEVRQFNADDELKYASKKINGQASGLIADPANAGTVVATVSSDKVPVGTTIYSKVVSDNFGFMCHANGSNAWNILNIVDGTTVTSDDAVFLVKKVNAIITVDDATIDSTGKGTIVQIIDNDDDYVGLNFAAEWGEDNEYGHKFGQHMPTFNSVFNEEKGYSNEWIAETSAAANKDYDVATNWTVDYNMTNTKVEGDLWNSTGYVGRNPATTMNVNLGKGAAVTGIISSGAFSHDTKHAEVGAGDWTQASALGHVTNIANSNGVNLVNVALTDDAVWTVTGNSIVNNVTASSSAIVAKEGVVVTVQGTLTLDGKAVTADKTVGNVTFDVNDGHTPGADKPSSGNVQTGDTAMPMVIGGVAILALAALVVLFVMKKRQSREV